MTVAELDEKQAQREARFFATVFEIGAENPTWIDIPRRQVRKTTQHLADRLLAKEIQGYYMGWT